MSLSGIIEFNGLEFLEELEKVFNARGLNGVISIAEITFPIGGSIRMGQIDEIKDDPVYRIEKIVIAKINPEILVFSIGDETSDSIIRSMSLPHVDVPFQIAIYGHPVNSEGYKN